MPRLIPKRAKPYTTGPAPALTAPLVVTLHVAESFNCEGFSFTKGDVVNPNDELVQRIAAEFPSLFEQRLPRGG